MKFPSFHVDLAFEVMSAVNMDTETRTYDNQQKDPPKARPEANSSEGQSVWERLASPVMFKG